MALSDKQLHIIETAEQLFAENGFDGTSVRDIAEAADVNVAMISYYFGSKEKLLEAMFGLRAGDTTLQIENMLHDNTREPIEKLNQLIEYYIGRFQEHHNFYKIMMREQVTNHRGVTSQLIRQFKKQNQQLIKQLIHEGQRKGNFNKHVDVPLLMGTLIGTVSHIINTRHFYREINNLESMADEQFNKLLKKKLVTHLKFIFKAILTHEA